MTKETDQKICDLLYARDMEGMKLLFRHYYNPFGAVGEYFFK